MSRLAIVTGASTGIGAATASRLADRGDQVISIARRRCPDERIESLQLDLMTPLDNANTAHLVQACQQHDSVALVHCAGWLTGDSAHEVSHDNLQRAFQVNVAAPALLNAALMAHLPAGSAIVFVSSTLGDKAVPGALSYATSKHAVNGLMRATCQDLAGRDIHAACVSPGFTDTDMLRAHVGHDEAVLESIAAGVTFSRLISADEIAATIEFCIDHPVINGAVIHANLGQIER
ncbi:MAG: SDR family oxidoreductase [Pseudomonadota bacterium]